MQKPRSLWQFERVLMLATVMETANTLAFASRARAIIAESAEIPPDTWSYYLALLVVSPAFACLIWFFVIKRASNAARIVYSALVAIGALGLPDRVATSAVVFPLYTQAILIITTCVLVYGVWLLWRPDSREWFGKGVGTVKVPLRHADRYREGR